jgi:hypothetical protein
MKFANLFPVYDKRIKLLDSFDKKYFLLFETPF